MLLLAGLLLVLLCGGAGAINPGGFPNSITGPLRGWRSWNAVFSDVTQEFITRQVIGISRRRHSIGGKPTSLLDLGFERVGIDSGWAECSGVNGSWHDEHGHFIVNKTSFPDMKRMVDHGHSLGVKMGFYLNQDLDPGYHSCKSEGQIPGAAANTGNFASYKNDAEDTAKLGFDGVKFDAGGGNDNMTLWAQAINATGRSMMLEDCNDGGHKFAQWPKSKNLDCPFNMFRTGIDNSPSPLSMISNLMDVNQYLNVSQPGCYAYPDMLELGAPVVGRWAATSPRDGPNSPPRRSTCGKNDGTLGDTAPRLSLEQGMAEYAAWCTVSSPLILGFDMGNDTEYDQWWPVISNPRALEGHAAWAGLAGKLLGTGPTFRTVTPHGASCEDMKDTRDLPSWSAWGKPMPGGRWAVVAVNSLLNITAPVAVSFASLGMPTATELGVTVTDVWTGRVSTLGAGAQAWAVTLAAGGHAWVTLEPKKSVGSG